MERHSFHTMKLGEITVFYAVHVNFDDGLTNFIMVDRAKLIKTGLEELKALEDKFITLEIQFFDEVYKSIFDLQ